jgi:hypothetical protein
MLLSLSLIITICDAICPYTPTHLNITNGLGAGLDLTIHCKSKDDDLGQHVVPFDGEYTIDFCTNFWRTTVFFCGMSWSSEFHWFDISTMLPGILIVANAIGQYKQLGHAWIIINIFGRNLYVILGIRRHIFIKVRASSLYISSPLFNLLAA